MSEKHYPYMGGCFDRIIFDGDGTSWVREHPTDTVNIKPCPLCGFEFIRKSGDVYVCDGCGSTVSCESENKGSSVTFDIHVGDVGIIGEHLGIGEE